MMTLKSIPFLPIRIGVSMFAVVAVSLLAVSCQPDEAEPTDDRDKFVDVWHCVEQSSQVGQTNYDVHINLSTTNTSQVLMENFYNVGFAFKAVANISGSTVTLNQQTYNASQLQGSGSMSGNNTINLNYTVNDGSAIDTCTAVLTRQ